MPSLSPDPLRILYLIVMPDVLMTAMSPFQGFSPGWFSLDWALRTLADVPGDVLENIGTIDDLIALRMGGTRQLDWAPVSVSALEALAQDDIGIFAVAFSGDADVADRVEAWRHRAHLSVLHVTSSDRPGCLGHRNFGPEAVMQHCRDVLSSHEAKMDPERQAAAHRALEAWHARPWEEIALVALGHNVNRPNHMSLRRARRSMAFGGPFIAATPGEYDRVIIEGCRAVMDVRRRAGIREFHRMLLVHPEVYLVEPAMVRSAYAGPKGRRDGENAVARRVLRAMQTQRGFMQTGDPDMVRAIAEPGLANSLVGLRASELSTFTSGVGLAAAQTASAVMRLSPAINHVFPALDAYGRNARSSSAEGRRKTARLFRKIQDDMVAAVGRERMAFIEHEVSGPVKIVSDAPVEWLPVRGLPLMLRHQTSRLNATPGNLLMGELARNAVVTVTPDAIRDVLVISAFSPTDPLHDVLRGALEVVRKGWEGKIALRFARATTVAAFEAELTRFEGGILIFDGHGTLNAGDGVGKLLIGDERLDVWTMRGRVRVPPVVILSACDTHGADSRTHATVGNGFLALGAMTVLATLLPIGGLSAAAFVARLVYRLADFVEAMMKPGYRVINWTEIVTGMQRMLLVTEILDALVGPPVAMGSDRMRLQLASSIDINSDDDDWFEHLIAGLAALRNESEGTVAERIGKVIAGSEAIRYVQLGHPENILIDDGSVDEAITRDGSEG